MTQVCIYPKDAARLTGTQYTAGKRLLQRIRAALGKPAGSYVSVGEFCAYTRLPEPEVTAAINGVPVLPRR
ncbi:MULTISPECIES: hypothetical protein [Hymenobacter]|uniref:Uncharacterized protein n=1 Tax=Hymenobacter psychrophilus TaxID=651662 RepID=A0A1H3NE65_9BACT|nr:MULTISPECIES: hypothetical protein [Hymenobacter]SDY86479.1 hypothetical protein SAMN04488069_11637 [Hymenobacter psychrophilus]